MYNPGFFPSRATPGAVRGARDPWQSSEEGVMIRSFGSSGFPVQVVQRPLTPLELLVLDFGMAELNPVRRQIIHEPPLRFIGQPDMQVSRQQDESRLTQDEQKKVLKQLKLEIYNPTPKRLSRRLCLYYRDQAQNIVKEREKEIDEDGKRCAVCLDDFEPKELVMLTPCNHMFHEDCIVPWVKSHGQCPVCRLLLYKI